MTNKLKKLNHLKRPESFVQVNTIKGFKYIDRAGEIVNMYHKDNLQPNFNMSLDGLLIIEPVKNVAELKITPAMFWMKFTDPGSLSMVEDIFGKNSLNICSVLDIEQVSRVGWRTYFVYEFKSENDLKHATEQLLTIKQVMLETVKFQIVTNTSYKVNLRIQPVEKRDKEKTYGLLFDVDIYQEDIIDIVDIGKILKVFREYLQGEAFLEKINQILS